MHLTKSIMFGRYSAMTFGDLLRGLALGGSMVAGSWTGRKLIDRLPEKSFALLIETLLIVSAVSLILTKA